MQRNAGDDWTRGSMCSEAQPAVCSILHFASYPHKQTSSKQPGMHLTFFCFFQWSCCSILRNKTKQEYEISSAHTGTHEQSSKCHSYPQVPRSFVCYTCDRSSSSPLSDGWTAVFTFISARHTRGASLRGCRRDGAPVMHSGWLCSFGERWEGW